MRKPHRIKIVSPDGEVSTWKNTKIYLDDKILDGVKEISYMVIAGGESSVIIEMEGSLEIYSNIPLKSRKEKKK